MTWILVAVFTWNSAVTLGPYATKEKCEAARQQLIDGIGVVRSSTAACVSGPERAP